MTKYKLSQMKTNCSPVLQLPTTVFIRVKSSVRWKNCSGSTFYDHKWKQAEWSDANNFVTVLNLIKFHRRESYFHIVHARKTCVTAYLNSVEDRITTVRKIARFLRKYSYGLHRHCSVRPVCCAKNIVTCLWIFFSWIRRDGMRKERSSILTPLNPVTHRRFRESKIPDITNRWTSTASMKSMSNQ